MKEPRSPPAAASEVELPPSRSEAARTPRQRDLQRDAEGPTTPTGTFQATPPKRIRPVLGVLFTRRGRADARARCRDYQNAELNSGRAS